MYDELLVLPCGSSVLNRIYPGLFSPSVHMCMLACVFYLSVHACGR